MVLLYYHSASWLLPMTSGVVVVTGSNSSPSQCASTALLGDTKTCKGVECPIRTAPSSLCYFRPFHYALKSKNLKPRAHQQRWLLQQCSQCAPLCLRCSAVVAQPPAPRCCVCRELCRAGSQSVFVSVLKGDARCYCFVTEDRQSLLNINAHVLKVPGLPVDDN